MTKLKELPPPLARQIVFRFVGAGLSLFACICSFLLYGEPYLSISLLAIALVVGISGAWFYYTVATGQYVVVEGRCQKVEQTYLFRKNKSVYVFADPHTIKVVPHRRNMEVQVGDMLRFYIASRTPVYHADHCKVLIGYMAMEILKGADK